MEKTEKLKKKVEGLRRGSERRYRKIVDDIPVSDDEGYEGKEMILNRSDGTHDLLKRLGGRWVRFSGTLNGLEIKKDKDNLPGLEIEFNGKRYRISMEEID